MATKTVYFYRLVHKPTGAATPWVALDDINGNLYIAAPVGGYVFDDEALILALKLKANAPDTIHEMEEREVELPD